MYVLYMNLSLSLHVETFCRLAFFPFRYDTSFARSLGSSSETGSCNDRLY